MRTRIIIFTAVLTMGTLSCALTEGAGQTPSVEQIETRAVEEAFIKLTEQAADQAAEAEPERTATPAPTETVEYQSVSVTLSNDTNCRTGPSINYKLISVAQSGQKYDVVGRYPNGPYVVIELPSAQQCWLWLEHATIVGDVGDLPAFTPPPEPVVEPPEPSTPFVLSHHGYNECGEDIYLGVVYVENNSDIPFRSAYVDLIHLRSGGGTHGMFNQQDNAPFLDNAFVCPSGDWDYLVPGASQVDPGGSAYISLLANQRSSAYGENVQATVKVCEGDDLKGTCYEEVVVFGLPAEWKDG